MIRHATEVFLLLLAAFAVGSIVAGFPLIRTALPTMSAAPPKSRCQIP